MEKRKLLLLSSSITSNNQCYLNYAQDEIRIFLKQNNVNKVIFIPYALPNCDKYEEKVKPVFNKMVISFRSFFDGRRNIIGARLKWYTVYMCSFCPEIGFALQSLHKQEDIQGTIKAAEAIFIGGGNTFLLLKILYELKLVELIRNLVLEKGLPYIGSSAGTNVSTPSICTTNDMPIVYPPSFEALNLIPFNINPHYLHVDKETSKHMGETRDERIEQYLEVSTVNVVAGIREGCILKIDGNSVQVRGVSGVRIFRKNSKCVEYCVGENISFLMQESENLAVQ